METVAETSHKPINQLKEKQTNNCPHQIFTESDEQIHIDTNNNGISES